MQTDKVLKWVDEIKGELKKCLLCFETEQVAFGWAPL